MSKYYNEDFYNGIPEITDLLYKELQLAHALGCSGEPPALMARFIVIVLKRLDHIEEKLSALSRKETF